VIIIIILLVIFITIIVTTPSHLPQKGNVSSFSQHEGRSFAQILWERV